MHNNVANISVVPREQSRRTFSFGQGKKKDARSCDKADETFRQEDGRTLASKLRSFSAPGGTVNFTGHRLSPPARTATFSSDNLVKPSIRSRNRGAPPPPPPTSGSMRVILSMG